MSTFKIDCSDEMMAKIEAIAFSETRVEVGGFLIGKYDANGATVTDVVAAQHSVGRSTQLTFTHDTWNALHSDLKESGGELVGWFHSHPNFGVFLSEHDQFIQENFFKADGNITIVVDPIRGRRGWFYSAGGKIKKYEKEEDTTRERLGVSSTNPDENIEAIMGTNNSGMTTAKVVLISAVMSLVGTFLGFALNTATSGGGTTSTDIAALNQRIQFLEAQLGLSITTAVPTKTQKPAPAPKTSSTKKSTTKPATTTKTAPKSETPTAGTNLTTTTAIKGAKCNPVQQKVAVGSLICKRTKGKAANVGTWVTVSSQKPGATTGGTTTGSNAGSGATTGGTTNPAPAAPADGTSTETKP